VGILMAPLAPIMNGVFSALVLLTTEIFSWSSRNLPTKSV
jgi:hypothetical protein